MYIVFNVAGHFALFKYHKSIIFSLPLLTEEKKSLFVIQLGQIDMKY